MKRLALLAGVCSALALAAPARAATPPPSGADMATVPPPDGTDISAARVAPAAEPKSSKSPAASLCMADLRTLSATIHHDGYWLGGGGYGYPLDGYGYGGAYPTGMLSSGNANYFRDARPGYDVRVLMAAATILASQGKQTACEGVLTTTRVVYQQYLATMRARGVDVAHGAAWDKQQIDAAVPVTASATAFQSGQLIDTDVRDAKNQLLGSIHDVVVSPKTGKIAYLIVARGGFLGFDRDYAPVPWGDFKAAPGSGLMVLDTTPAIIAAAPQIDSKAFSVAGHFDKQSDKVDAYWKANPMTVASN